MDTNIYMKLAKTFWGRRVSFCTSASKIAITAFFLIILSNISTSEPIISSTPEPAISKSTLEVKINGRSTKLDILIGWPGPYSKVRTYPVALITHGAAGHEDLRNLKTSLLSGWVNSLSTRGYLAVAVMPRRNGNSDGMEHNSSGSCDHPTVAAYFDTQATDMAVAVAAISWLPNADMSRIIGIGHSAGGVGMLALSARADNPLTAVINVAGGAYRSKPGAAFDPYGSFVKCPNYADDLVKTIAAYASQASAPTLWLYAQNASFFH